MRLWDVLLPPIQQKQTHFIGYVGTQHIRLQVHWTYMSLLQDMPEYPERLDNIKTYLKQSALSKKPTFRSKSTLYSNWNLLGYQDDPAKVNMEKIENLSFEQIKNFYQSQIKNKPVTIIIFGDPKLIDLKTIQSKYGKINKLSNNTLFSKLSM